MDGPRARFVSCTESIRENVGDCTDIKEPVGTWVDWVVGVDGGRRDWVDGCDWVDDGGRRDWVVLLLVGLRVGLPKKALLMASTP